MMATVMLLMMMMMMMMILLLLLLMMMTGRTRRGEKGSLYTIFDSRAQNHAKINLGEKNLSLKLNSISINTIQHYDVTNGEKESIELPLISIDLFVTNKETMSRSALFYNIFFQHYVDLIIVYPLITTYYL